MPGGSFRVFYSYSHADARMLDRLRKHLAMLRRHGLITEWYDRDIEAGSEWREEIANELEAADVLLLLVSADFLASDFCYEEEMLRAVERAEADELMLIGVMLRPVDGWETTPFAKFQVTPRNARPITTWSNTDEAYRDVAASIRTALETHIRSSSVEDIPVDTAPVNPAVNRDAAARVAEIERLLHELQQRTDARLKAGESLDWDHEFMIIVADAELNYYTQCYAEEAGDFWCETVSNEFLYPRHALDARQESHLLALGWNRPQQEAVPNWWCVQSDTSDVAQLFVRTVNEVYRVALDAPFQIEVSWAE